MRGDAATNLKRWQQGSGELRVVTSKAEWDVARGVLAEADLIVDALLGTGLTGPVEGLLAQVIEDVNAASDHGAGTSQAKASRRVRESCPWTCLRAWPRTPVDLGGPVIAADVTVTLTAPKLGQMVSPRADRVGKLVVREIGTPPELLDDDPHLKLHWLEPGEFRDLPLVRRRDSNKGTFGHALVVAGSLGKSGAARPGRARGAARRRRTRDGGDAHRRASRGRRRHAGADDRASARHRDGQRERGQFRLRPFRRHHSRQVRAGDRPRPFDRRPGAAVHSGRGARTLTCP